MKNEALSLRRYIVFLFLIFAALLTLLARLVRLQIGDHDHYAAMAHENQIRLLPIPAPRGLILDRNGRVLVRNRPSYVCTVVPANLHDPAQTLTRLAFLLRLPRAALAARLARSERPDEPVVLADELGPAAVARLAEALTDMTGVDLQIVAVRDYAYRQAASHVFGYVGRVGSADDVVGQDGLENEYDHELRGKNGGREVQVDAGGSVVDELGIRPSTPGNQLVLTLDWRLQLAAERALGTQLQTWSKLTGRRLTGAVVVEDVHDGGILALASQPNFNPNDFAVGIDQKHYTHYLRDTAHPLFNRAIGAATAVGSTFKLVTGSAAISEHVLDPNAVILDPGTYVCHGTAFSDIVAGSLGRINFTRALAASSDGYFYRAADLLGHERLRRYALDFGLAQATQIDLPGEFSGNWPTMAWSMRVYGVPLEASDVCQLGIGQGAMEATPLQMADVAAVIANGGTLYRPHFLAAVRDENGFERRRIPIQILRHVPISTLAVDAVRRGMVAAVHPGGTAAGYEIPGFEFAGKTGTVETDGGRGPNTTWFVAYAPADSPQVAMAIFIEKSGNYGAVVAAPVAQSILRELHDELVHHQVRF